MNTHMSPDTREHLNQLAASRGDVTHSEADRFAVCVERGQATDLRRLDDVFHYDEPRA